MLPREHPSWPVGGAKPYVRWWWLSGPFRSVDIDSQLQWIKEHGFGGVELAWLWPVWLASRTPLEPVPHWLGPDWTGLVEHAKRTAERLGLGCDFTFGSCWPFGGSCVSLEHAAQTFDGWSGQEIVASWESSDGNVLRVLDHLSHDALQAYADTFLKALRPALVGQPAALFCDSLEIRTQGLWHPRLWEEFAERFNYRLEPFATRLEEQPDVRHDYRCLIADTMLREFYEALASICDNEGAISRVQCHGSLTDLLAAYAAVDVPESEAILFEPHFSRIAASAAALARKPVVSCETFTCLYGFVSRTFVEPIRYWRRENLRDFKLLADAVLSHGVNQIVWHGMPYNGPTGVNEFYASVHVGPDAIFAPQLPEFNRYLERVCSWLRQGEPVSNLALYLPIEDAWMLDRIPQAERTPAANYRWELRHARPALELEGYHPLWVSLPFLRQGHVQDGRLHVGGLDVGGLYIDSDYVSMQSLVEFVRLAEAGLKIVLRRDPKQPGHCKSAEFAELLERLRSLQGVVRETREAKLRPFVEGVDLPLFWCRRLLESTLFFFAHPASRHVQYPLRFGQSDESRREQRTVRIPLREQSIEVELDFEAHQSLMLIVFDDGRFEHVDIHWNAT